MAALVTVPLMPPTAGDSFTSMPVVSVFATTAIGVADATLLAPS